VATEFADTDLVIWALASGEAEGTVEDFVSELDIDLTVLLDATGEVHASYDLLSAFPTAAYPEEWLIDREGNVAFTANAYDRERLVAAIEGVL
jgi:peroxiredoxin